MLFSDLLDIYQKKKIQPQANEVYLCMISVDKLRTRCVGVLLCIIFTSVFGLRNCRYLKKE